MTLSLPIGAQYDVRRFRCWVCLRHPFDTAPDCLDAPEWIPAGAMVFRDLGNGVPQPLQVGVFR